MQMLKPDQSNLVQTSFALVLPMKEEVALLFYGRLFELEPAARLLFSGDIKAQGAKLMATLATVVQSLDDLRPLDDTISNLARRHIGYGVSERQYYAVGAALIWALEQSLGSRFTSDARHAWLSAYGLLSSRMMSAARAASNDNPSEARTAS